MHNYRYLFALGLIILLVSANVIIAGVNPSRVLAQSSNSPPVASDDSVNDAIEDIATTVNVLQNDSDPDDDPLVVSITVPPTYGSLEINADQSITYTPDPDFNGDDGFEYSVEDDESASDVAIVSIVVASVNDAPVAIDQSLNTAEETLLTILLTANDVDNAPGDFTYSILTSQTHGSLVASGGASYDYTPDPDYVGPDSFTFQVNDGLLDSQSPGTITLTITAISDSPVANDDGFTIAEDTAINMQVLGNDSNPDTGGGSNGLTLASVGASANGASIVLNPGNNTVTYTPPSNYTGLDTFTYNASNADLLEDSATVTVTIDPVNDSPTASSDSASTSKDTPVDIDVLLNDNDIDGDSISITSVAPPTHGTASISTTDNSKITYTPELNYFGPDSFEYTISDGQGASSSALVSISMSNADPIATEDAASTDEDNAVLIPVLTNDSDPNGDSISVDQITILPAYGTAVINSDNSAITYTPTANYSGPDSFEYSITDGQSTASATVTISIIPVNDPPVAAAGSDTTDEDTSLAITLFSAGDIDSAPDTLTFTIVTGPSSGTLSGQYPANLVYSPSNNYFGSDSFVFKVTDDEGLESTALFQITVNPVNDEPVAAAGPDQTVNEGLAVTLDGSASADPEGDPLGYTWSQVSGPPATLDDNNSIEPTFTAPVLTDASVENVTLKFRLTADDGQGASDFDEVRITVINTDGRPIANAGFDQEVTEGETAGLDASYSTDPDGTIVTYSWSQILGQTAALSSTSAIQPTFTAPNVGPAGETLRFQLTVTDNNGETSVADTVDVLVLNRNQDPIAQAGDDQAVDEETLVTLNGAASYDPDATPGETLSFNWTQLNGTTVSLSDRFSASPTFTAPSIGATSVILIFEMTVVDNLGGNATDFIEVLVSNVNKPPVANAGVDKTASEGAIVTLTGSSSNDPDGEPLSYFWSQVSGPSVILSNVTATNPTFEAPDVTSTALFTFELTVSDGSGASSVDAVGVTVNNVVGYNVQGFAPSFIATGSKDFDIPDSASIRLTKFTLAAWFKTSANYGGNAMIVNKGGLGSDSAGQNMNYGIWMNSAEKLVAGFEKATNGADITVISTNSYSNGQWHYAVVTFDGSIVRLYVNGVPIGTKSGTGPETNVVHPLTIGANSNPSGNANYFIGEIDEVRLWTMALTAQDVLDQYNVGGPTNALYKVYMDGKDYNQAPLANAGPDKTVIEFDSVLLEPFASTDPDGDSPLSYSWTQTAGPTLLTTEDAGSLSFTAPEVITGTITFTFELVVADPSGAKSSDTVSVLVQNNNQLPVALAGPDLAADEGDSLSLDGSSSYDPDTDPLTYSWKQLSGPVVSMTGANTALPSFTAPMVSTTMTLTFELSVNDGFVTAKDTINVLVYNVLGGYRYDPEFIATGSNEYKISDSSSLRLKIYSVEAWLRTTQSFTSDVMIVNKGGFGSDSSGQNMNYGIWMDANEKVKGGFETSSGTDNFITSAASLNDGDWHYVVLTFDGSSLKLYVDGALAASKSTTAQPESTGTYPVVLGANSRDTTKNKFKGEIDEVRILNRALPASEISTQFDLGQFAGTGLVVYMDGVAHNNPPVANAGADKTAYEDDNVSLSGSGSSDPNGNPLTYSWTQIAGPVVTLSNPNVANPQFIAPSVASAGAILTFRLTVSDGKFDSSDTVNVNVNNLSLFFEASGSDYLDIPYLSSMKIQQFSLAAKFKTSSNFAGDSAIVNRGGFGSDSSAQNMNYGIWMNSAEKLVAGFETSSGADNYVTSPNSYSDNTWHSVFVTFSGSSLKLYVDGVQVASKTTSSKPDSGGTQPLRLGANSRALNSYFIGSIDDVKLWKRALSASEVTSQFGTFSTAPAGEMIYFDGQTTFFAPIAKAGSDQTVQEDNWVTLDGSASFDVNGDPLSYSWKQTAGPSVTLTSPTVAKPTFKAPLVSATSSLTFELKVSNARYSSTDTVVISVTDLVVSVSKVLPTYNPNGPTYMKDVTTAIRNADDYIYGAFFYVEAYSTNTVLNELANAAASPRNVDVKLIVSDHALTLYPNLPQQLAAKGIPYHIDSNHAKVVVIDDEVAYIGSANWNKNGLQNNWELTYKSTDAAAIAEAKEFVSTLWYKGSTSVKYNSLASERPVNGQEYVDQVLSILKNAKTSIKVAMFEAVYDAKATSSAHSQILWEIKNADGRGVNLQMLLDDPRYYNHTGGIAFFNKYNIPHKLDDLVSGFLERKHVKAFLVDDSTLVIGSHNWNWDSANSSQEYSIIIRGKPTVNAEFSGLFSGIWNKGIWEISP